MDKATLSSRIKRRLNRPSLSQDDIDEWIETVEGELNRALKEHPRNQLRTSFPQPFDNNLVPLPVDMMELISLRWGANGKDMDQFGPRDRLAAAQAGSCGMPSYIERGTVFEVFPTPTAPPDATQEEIDAGQTFEMDYIAALKPLVNDLDENWVSVYHGDIYLYGCLKEAAVFLKDDKRLAGWENQFLTRLGELDSQGWNQNMGANPTIKVGGAARRSSTNGYSRG